MWAVSGDVIRAVTILVVFCPSALVLATPTAVMAGIGQAAKINVTAIVLASTGWMGPVLGALWHNVGSVLVVANSASLIRPCS